MQAEHGEREVGDSALDSRLAPVPQNRAAEPGADHRSAGRARRTRESPVMPAGPCSRWTTSEVELLAALALAGEPLDVAPRLRRGSCTGPTRTSA